ncbi:MAG: hypothetical protein CSA42_00270 [Gammaproteobacteria bacterium]|nr:MAG: hypothetical protein CSA42_00270 [Gammaproteobacteria bacterium]
MENLEIYRKFFDTAYPNYADTEYEGISRLIRAIPDIDKVISTFKCSGAKEILGLIVPLIKIKNYKSQIPFPEDIYYAAQLIAEIKNGTPKEKLSKEHVDLFGKLLEIEGFQLPTVSAVLHFCHPAFYPIVDRNIESACNSLLKEIPDSGITKPELPASTTTTDDKLSKYRQFISCLTELRKLHNTQYATNYNFRELDKALMVYGDDRQKKKAENANTYEPSQVNRQK